MKKKSPQETVEELAREIRDTIARWKKYKESGCSDPAYPDGLNMNLLRNHVMYYKQKIREICSENNLTLPEEVYLPNLPYVDNNYFAKPQSERAQRIMQFPNWRSHNHEKPSMEYDESALTLF